MRRRTIGQEDSVLSGRLLMLLFLPAGLLFLPCASGAERSADDRSMFSAKLVDPAFASAWKDYEAGRYSEACGAFSQLFRENPSDVQINLAYALAAKRAGKYS
ncbi:MAG: hypothetical protein PHG65_08110, partial [Kiritimatiellae bacterium]|nr:hypothetical protein [Kiritimatiellia bacterium]